MKSNQREKYNSLDGLRAYSAIGIAMMHFLANIKCAYAKAIQAVSGKIPAHILDGLIESLRSFNSGIECLELELDNNGYSFDDLAYLTAIVDAAERNKSRAGGEETP